LVFSFFKNKIFEWLTGKKKKILKRLSKISFYLSTQLRSYGAEIGNMILAKLGLYKYKAIQSVKNPSPAGAKKCIDSSNWNP
jgi:hypothetical protein